MFFNAPVQISKGEFKFIIKMKKIREGLMKNNEA